MADCYFYPWLIRLAHSKVIMLIVIVYATCKPHKAFVCCIKSTTFYIYSTEKIKENFNVEFLHPKKNIWSYNCM